AHAARGGLRDRRAGGARRAPRIQPVAWPRRTSSARRDERRTPALSQLVRAAHALEWQASLRAQPMIEKLSDDEINTRMAALPTWALRDGKLYRELAFADFVHAF